MCKWINNNTFLTISDFVDKRFVDNFAFGRLRTSSDFFGRLRTSSGIFGNDRVVCKNPRTPRIKISRLYLRKSWQVYGVWVGKVCMWKEWLAPPSNPTIPHHKGCGDARRGGILNLAKTMVSVLHEGPEYKLWKTLVTRSWKSCRWRSKANPNFQSVNKPSRISPH